VGGLQYRTYQLPDSVGFQLPDSGLPVSVSGKRPFYLVTVSLALSLSRFAVSFSEAELRPSNQLQREHVLARVLSSLVITSVVTFAGMFSSSPCLPFPGFGFVEFGPVYTKLGPFERNLAHLWFCLCSLGAQTSASLSARIFFLVSAASVFSGNFLLLRL
jgi:hypothetical protein